MWNERRDAHHLVGFETIYVVVEPDQGGESVLRWVRQSSIRDRVRLVHLTASRTRARCMSPIPKFRDRWDAALRGRSIRGSAAARAAEPPTTFTSRSRPADAFPLRLSATFSARRRQAIHDKVQAPIAICAQSVLAAATLAVQGRADVQLPTGQSRPISGYFITVAGSGERKTSADREALWPISRARAEPSGALRRRTAGLPKRAGCLGEAAGPDPRGQEKYPDPAAKRAALDELGPAPVGPLHPMLVCPEPTFEGLERLFAVGQPSMGVFSGEGGQFVGGLGCRRRRSSVRPLLSRACGMVNRSGECGLWMARRSFPGGASHYT